MSAVERQRVGDDILVGQLVVDVARKIVTGVDGSAIDILIRVRQRRANWIVAKPVVDSDYRASVGSEAGSAEQRHGTALVAEVRAGIEAARRGKSGIESGAQAEIGVRLEDDIDNARHPFRVVLGGWIRH